MSKEAAVQLVKDEGNAPEIAAPDIEPSQPVTDQTAAPESKVQVATAAAVKKASAKPKSANKSAAAQSTNKEVVVQPAPAPKSSAKAVKKAPVAAKEKLAAAPKVEKSEKAGKDKKLAPKKPKLVRDSFTIPEADYALFATLKQRALSAGVDVKKSEILRAALAVLAQLDDAELVKSIGLVERIKTGRPKK